MGSLTALDIVVMILVCGGAIAGFSRGFVQELLSLLAWVLAILAVRMFHEPVTGMLTPSIGTETGAAVAGFALLFGVVFMLGKWLSRSIGAKSRQSVVGPFDRVLGAGFGMVKGMVIATALFMLATLVVDVYAGREATRPEWMRDSRTFPALNASSAAMSALIDLRRPGTPPPAPLPEAAPDNVTTT